MPNLLDFHSFFSVSGNTIATAESCTGGNIAHHITLNSGSSAYFLGSVVAYSNTIKQALLGVDSETLTQHGAVSAEVVSQMAEGARKLLHTDYAVSTSGIAGPTGGSAQKPVGLVWMAVAGKSGVVTKKFIFSGTRAQIIEEATHVALVFVMEQIKFAK